MEQLLRFLRTIWLTVISTLMIFRGLWHGNPPPLPAQPPQQKKKKSKRKKIESAEQPEKPASSSHCIVVAKMDFFAKYKDSCTLECEEKMTTLLFCETIEETVVLQKSLQHHLRETCLIDKKYALKLPNCILVLMAQFNCLATFENNYHSVLFLCGSGTLLEEPNNWNLMCNASLPEIEQILIKLGHTFQLIFGKHPLFQFEQSDISIRIRPLPGPPEEDFLMRIQRVQQSVHYKQDSLMCTYHAEDFYWKDPFNVLNPIRKNKFYMLELLCPGTTTEEKAETLIQGIIFLAFHEDYRIDNTTEKWFVDNKACLQSASVLNSLVELLQSTKSSRGLYLLKRFGLLHDLCPALIPCIDSKAFNSGTANFDRHLSGQFRAQMPRNYQNMLYETLALFLYPAREQIKQDWGSMPFLNPGQMTLIEAQWTNNGNITRYWSSFIKTPTPQTFPHALRFP